MTSQTFFNLSCYVAGTVPVYVAGLYAVKFAQENLSGLAWRIRFAREAVAYAVALIVSVVR